MRRFESPLEAELFRKIESYTTVSGNDGTRIETQVSVKTKDKNYRLDLIIYCQGRAIAFECDGADYHSGVFARSADLCRDCCILMDTNISSIFRLDGSVIYDEDKLPLALYMANSIDVFITDPKRKEQHLNECLPILSYNQYCREADTIDGYDYVKEGLNSIENHRNGRVDYNAIDYDHYFYIRYRDRNLMKKFCDRIEAMRMMGMSMDEIVQEFRINNYWY